MRLSVCIAFSFFVMFLSGCGSLMSSDGWNHFAFSASISSVGTAVTSEPVQSIGITAGLGLLKEIHDLFRGTGFQACDLAADIAGAVAGGFVAAEICMEEFP